MITDKEQITEEKIMEIMVQTTAVVEIDGQNNSQSNTFYHHQDHLNGSSVVTGNAGQLLNTEDYYPFGTSQSSLSNGTYSPKLKFTGKEYEQDSQLYYYEARYYNPSIGRFTGADPASRFTPQKFLQDPQQLNLYSYTRNNPVRYTDPTGESTEVDENTGAIISVVDDGSNAILSYPYVDGVRAEGPGRYWGESSGSVQGPLNDTTWDPVTDRRIAGLDPSIRDSATKLINDVELQTGVQLRVTTGYRSNEEQDRLYNQSRTNPPIGPWATNAKGGQSYHNYGLAVDVVIMDGGQAIWIPLSSDVANLGYGQGFEWGGYWNAPSTDPPHFQMP